MTQPPQVLLLHPTSRVLPVGLLVPVSLRCERPQPDSSELPGSMTDLRQYSLLRVLPVSRHPQLLLFRRSVQRVLKPLIGQRDQNHHLLGFTVPLVLLVQAVPLQVVLLEIE